MATLLFLPPITFIIIFFTLVLLNRLAKRLSPLIKDKSKGTLEPYACGEENYDPMAQPDYSNFFPYAFFFTLAHVATLIMTTVPMETLQTFTLAAIYIIGAILGLYILFRD